MRVCVLVHQFPVRSETFVLDQVEGLRRRGHEVVVIPLTPRSTLEWDYPPRVADVLAATAPTPATMPASGVARVVRTTQLAARAALSHRGAPLRYARDRAISPPGGVGRRLLLAERVASSGPFDVVHSQFGTTASAAVGLRRHRVTAAPIVCSIHGQDANVTAQANPERFASLLREMAAVTVGTQYMRGVVERIGAAPDTVRVWPQGVDVDRCQPTTGGPDGEFRVVSVGRLVEFKGVDDDLRVIAAVRSRIPTLRYRIVGDGPLRAELERLADALGVADITTFCGGLDHDDVLDEFGQADACLHMGKVGADGSREGQGVSVIEASASQVPVVATRSGGLTEVVADTGTGYLVDIGAHAAAADALAKLAGDANLRARLGVNGRSFVAKQFSLDASCDQLVALFSHVTQGR